jgi:hypothetical protein
MRCVRSSMNSTTDWETDDETQGKNKLVEDADSRTE